MIELQTTIDNLMIAAAVFAISTVFLILIILAFEWRSPMMNAGFCTRKKKPETRK